MCGFIQRVTDSPAVIDLIEQIGLGHLTGTFKSEAQGVLNFYPAFGKNPSRMISNLIVSSDTVVDATWWFDCKANGDALVVGDRTTFNARNLDSPFWKGAIRYHRALVIATAVGESNKEGASNAHYLMEGEKALLIGAVYREYDNGLYSTAVITRPPHERFSKYHSKSIPCFLPPDKGFVGAWLNGEADDPIVQSELANPTIHTPLKVTRVKTFKGGQALSEPEILAAD
ncbi:DUF159 family protein [Alteromonas sp. 345S023]|uniref:DUF159 family protein n=1 Tax=Alteromonas profundi TaxID=2696062 RepID=A0A7X5LMJ7_9ALTE|nr:SOS response-associated peptidase family protein [Alteromonas profundi]NDV92079.1 DUF159 family protein [Alteromonas profundi]